MDSTITTISEQNASILKKSPLYPFRFTPIYKDYIWGGERFQTLFARPIEPGKKAAESWEIADHDSGQSVVANGPLAGVSLRELIAARPEGVFGSESVRSDRFHRFPLMLKYLDVRDRLSVQVHPTDAYAQELELPDTGKTEAWVVVDAEPGSELFIGFNKKCSPAEVEAALQNGTLESLLHRIEPKIGDCYLIEPGTVHSAGKGVLLAEIQQTSDITFRLFDWNRPEPRLLQVEQALRAIDYDRGPIAVHSPHPSKFQNCEQLVIGDHFSLSRWKCEEMFVWNSDNRCHLWTVLQGEVTAIFHLGRRITPENLSGRQSDPIAMECLKPGDTLLVPNSCRSIQWTSDNDSRVVLLDVVGS